MLTDPTPVTLALAFLLLFLFVFCLTYMVVEPIIWKAVRWWRRRGDEE